MLRRAKLSAIALLALAAIVPAASARPPVVVVRGFVGPAFAPAFYGPRWVYVPGPTAGSVKIDTKLKDSLVYVDGGFAGTVAQLKTFPLRPGKHDIELRDPHGQSFCRQRIEVIAGKTIHITL